MFKSLLKFFLFLLLIVIAIAIYLNFFGIKTNKFDSLIKNKVNSINQYVDLEFKEIRIYLNLRELNIVLKLQKPQIILKNEKIKLSKLDLFLSIKSLFSSNFLLKRSEIAFFKNDIKDLTKITSVFLPKFINKKINNIFSSGSIEGKFVIPFNTDGTIANGYGFSGKVIEAKINLTKDLTIKELTTDISYSNKNEDGNYQLVIKKGSIYNLNLKDSVINLRHGVSGIKLNTQMQTKGKLDFLQIKKISNLLSLNINSFNNINGKINLKTKIDFTLGNKFKLKDLIYSTDGKIDYLEVYRKDDKFIKTYLPDYNAKFFLKDTIINFSSSKFAHNLKLNGFIKTKDSFDSIKIDEIYNKKNKKFDIKGSISLTNSFVQFSKLNYSKKSGEEAELKFDTSFVIKKNYYIKTLNFIAKKTQIVLSNLKLNNNFEILDFKKLKVITYNNKFKNNDFVVNKSKNILVSGDIFDAEPIFQSIYSNDDKRNFSKKFNSKIKVNLDKAISSTGDDIFDFSLISEISKGSYDKLSLKGNFSENEIIELSIYPLNNNKKTLKLVSDRARPFVKNFGFIKGFEGGKLDYESIISNEGSKSELLITEFQVSKVPALAKILTLASLQGIADTLSGEGIRFESFEMKLNSNGNVLTIEDALAMGPAVSILLDGYVEKNQLVSLRGTLVPATKLNALIASIPLIGDILVGKKTGEGVVGVSFKMKGPPKNIKTTVNPIKTLTPRFIVRAVENLKKKQKESK